MRMDTLQETLKSANTLDSEVGEEFKEIDLDSEKIKLFSGFLNSLKIKDIKDWCRWEL